MKDLIKMFSQKWIKGECRKLCLLCPYWKPYCKDSFFPDSKYAKGYAEGFQDGKEYVRKNMRNKG